MMSAIEEVAQDLNIAPETLWQQSLDAYVSRELRLVELDVADIQDRYGVVSPDQLESKIESGEIYSHPAWEDLIEWENLLVQHNRLSCLRSSLTEQRQPLNPRGVHNA
jgi:hypothetical protein